jgi:membrane associated rhomboid family serine protease
VLPYHDDNETQRTPVVTIAFVALNLVIWIVVQSAGNGPRFGEAVCRYALIPAELTQTAIAGAPLAITGVACLAAPVSQQPWKLLTWMFLHSSWMHVIGNMWFLWLFGSNVEDAMTRLRFAIFYVLCGLAAGIAQVASVPSSMAPLVGASGAVSGVMGAYLVLFPRVRMFTIVPYGFTMRSVGLPAWVMLAYWVLLQLLSGVLSAGRGNAGGVAVWAHIGGFVGGLTLVWLFRRQDRLDAHRARRWAPRRLGWR